MARNQACSIYIGNLDEKVSERVLYEILIQVGQVVDLHIPRDKETNRHKGYAFAEYETEEIADYAVRLFSGLVRLHNKTLKFAMSGQDKSTQNNGTASVGTPVTPKLNSLLPPNPYFVQEREIQNTGTPVTPKLHSPLLANTYFVQAWETQNTGTSGTPKLNSPLMSNHYSVQARDTLVSQERAQSAVNCRSSYGSYSVSPVYPQASRDGLVSRGIGTSNYEYSRRVFGAMVNNVGHPGTRHPITYPSY